MSQDLATTWTSCTYEGKGRQKKLLATSLHSCDQRALAFAEAHLVFGPAQRTSRFLQNFLLQFVDLIFHRHFAPELAFQAVHIHAFNLLVLEPLSQALPWLVPPAE